MSGFPEYSGDDALSLTTARPNTPQVVDDHGRQTVYGTTDNLDPSGNFPLDSRVVEFIEYGVLNGSFARSPADPNHDITDINYLPDWTGPVSVSGGAITAQWVADSGSPSGYNLRFTVNAGAAGDEVYVEQIVPIGGTRSQQVGHYVYFLAHRVTATSNNFVVKATLDYLDATGASTSDTFSTGLATFSADGTDVSQNSYNTSVAATARFLRIRIDVARSTAAASDTGTFDITDVRVARAWPVALFADTSTPANGLGKIVQTGGNLKLQAKGGVATGWVQLLNPLEVSEATPATPDSGYHAIYAKSSDSLLYSKDDSGNEYLLSSPHGTFTPALAYATVGSSSWAVTTAVGFYTRLSDRVIFNFTYQGVPTNGTGAGNLQLSGLPVTSQNTASSGARFSVEFQGYTKANFTQITGFVNVNATIATFRASGSAQTTAALTVTDIPTGGTVIVSGGGHYLI